MRKKFIRVAVLCALTATATPVFVGCSDYDDDISRLQGEVDKINGIIGVSGEEMTAAINDAISKLNTELQTAIAGKADNSAVQELQSKVAELTNLMDGKADASQLQTLADEIQTLTTEVNAVKGTLDQTKTELESQLADLDKKQTDLQAQLDEALKGDGSQNKIEELQSQIETNTHSIADLTNQLKTVTDAIDNNGEVITNLTNKITALEAFKEEIENKENPSFVDYATFNALASRVSDLETKMDDIAQKINDATAGQDSIADILKRLEALETWKSDTFQGLLDQKADASEIADINKTIDEIKTELSLVTDGGEEGSETSLDIINKQIAELEKRMESIMGNTVQSVVYVPNYNTNGNEYGDTNFSDLWFDFHQTGKSHQLLAQNKTAKIRFRVSPASAAETVAKQEKYTLTFEGVQRQSVRAAGDNGMLSLTNGTVADKNLGIVEFDVAVNPNRIASGTSWALSLSLKANEPGKDESKTDYTDVLSNFFVVNRKMVLIDHVQTACKLPADYNLVYNDANDVVDFGQEVKYVGYYNNSTVTGAENMAASFGDIFKTSYNVTDLDNENSFVIDGTGKVKINSDKLGNSSMIDNEGTVSATTTINGLSGRTFRTDYSGKVVITDAILSDALQNSDFVNTVQGGNAINNLIWTKNEQKFTLTPDAVTRIIGKSGLSTADFYKLFTTPASADSKNGKATLTIDGTNKTIYLTIDAKAAIGSGETITLVVNVPRTEGGADRKYTITYTVPATAKYPSESDNANNRLVKADFFWTEDGNAIFTPKYSITPAQGNTPAKVTAIDLTFDIKSLFSNYDAALKQIVTTLGGTLNVDATTAQGVTQSGTTVTFDKNSFNVNNGLPSVNANVSFGGHTVQDITGQIKVKNISGSWAIGKKALTITDRTKSHNASSGATWKDANGFTIWSDGAKVTTNYASGVDPFTLIGNTVPTYSIVNTNEVGQYVTINKTTGVLTFTEDGKNLELVKDMVIKVQVKAASRWGDISGYGSDADNVITVTVPAGN